MSPGVPDGEREQFVDALRGVALLGILFVNMEFYSQIIDTGWTGYTDGVDGVARWLLVALFQLKSYLVFALLFGYGLSLQLGRATTSGARFLPRYGRRLGGLAVLGALHGALFYSGDILLAYAVLGTLVIPFRRIGDRALLLVAACVFVLGIAVIASLPGDDGVLRHTASVRAVFSHGSFLEIVRQRLDDLVLAQAFGALVQWPSAFAFFLIGIVLGRRRALADPELSLPLFRRLVRYALPVGLVGGAVAATLGGGIGNVRAEDLGFLIQALTAPASALGYVGLAGVLAAGGRLDRVAPIAQSLGRMSLTAYLAESIVCSLIFLPYGLGLFGEVGPALGMLLAVVVWLVLVPLDRFWLARFRYGPFEWALRSLTYRELQPLRRRKSTI